MIKHYLHIASNRLMKYKTQHILSILGVAIGLTCFSVTTYYISRMNMQYTAAPLHKRIAQLHTSSPDNLQKNTWLLGREIQTISNHPVAGIEKIGWYDGQGSSNISFEKGEGESVPYRFTHVEANLELLEIFGARTLSGHLLTVQPGEAVITRSCARQVYGKEDPVGKTLHFSKADTDTSRTDYLTIAAVITDLAPLDYIQRNIFIIRDVPHADHAAKAVALLANEKSASEINDRLRQQFSQLNEKSRSYPGLQLYSELLMQQDRLILQGLVGLIAALVLIAGLINFLKFSINSFFNRTHELYLRKGLGARWQDLYCMLFTEITILLALAGLCACCFSELLVSQGKNYLPDSMREMDLFHIDLKALMIRQVRYLLLLFVLCAGIVCIAVRRIGPNIIQGIRDGKSHKHPVRNIMLGVQIFICIFFISMSAGVYRSYHMLEAQRYYTLSPKACEQIWEINLFETQLWGHEDEILSNVRKLKNVKEILFKHNQTYVEYQLDENRQMSGFIQEEGEDYFAFMQLPVQGTIPRNENEIVINRTLARQLERDQTGGSVLLSGKSYQVTGIIEQLPFKPMEAHPQPTSVFYAIKGRSTQADNKRTFYVKCVPGTQQETKQQILSLIRTYLPESIPFEIESQKEILFRYYGGLKMTGELLLFLSLISVFITILGIYSTISLDTQSRQKEIAIRKINGASQRTIIGLFGKLYLVLTGITAAFAVPVVFILLQSILNIRGNAFIYRPIFWINILLSITFLIFVTVGYHIWKISRINPSIILKNE